MQERGFFSNFLLSIVGADKSIMKCCPQAEVIKHESFGMMLLIPTMFSFFSMYYASSTIGRIDSSNSAIFVAVVWAMVILTIDRTLVTTFRKSDSILKDVVSFSFF